MYSGGALAANLLRGGGGGVYGTVGPMALASRSSSVSIGGDAPVTYDNEVFDTEGVFAATSGEMTVPSAGLYRLGVGSALNAYRAQKAQIDAAMAYGGYGATSNSNSPRWHSGWGAPLSLTASQVLRSINQFSGAANYGVDANTYTWMALERLPETLKYARVRKSADQTSFTSGNLSFDTEDADTDGWHDTVTNNERLTVPSGVTRVRLLGNAVTDSFSGQAEFGINKNGSADVVGLPSKRVSATGNKLINLFGPPINVTPGDYFTLAGSFQSSSNILAETFTWFAIEEVPASIKSALVYNSSGHGLTTTDATLTWDSEDHDPDAMHSTGSNTSRLTVPSGCSYARVSWHLKGQLNSTAYIWAQVGKNGAGVIGTAIDARLGLSGAYQRLAAASGWLQVSPGDYFELSARVNTGSITTTGGWFAMECV